MANWCCNSLTVSCYNFTTEIQEFKTVACSRRGEFCFGAFVPEPQQQKDPTAWRRENWGTRTEIEEVVCDEDDYSITYYFDTAWSPPLDWLSKTAALYPDLCFELRFEEPGEGFRGRTVYSVGVLELSEWQQWDWEEDED